MNPQSAMICVSLASAGHQSKLRDHGYGASASSGTPAFGMVFGEVCTVYSIEYFFLVSIYLYFTAISCNNNNNNNNNSSSSIKQQKCQTTTDKTVVLISAKQTTTAAATTFRLCLTDLLAGCWSLLVLQRMAFGYRWS